MEESPWDIGIKREIGNIKRLFVQNKNLYT
jgi:hypothetical protein